ncbi:uracil-DNA glycosylase [Lacisediminimonas sp.]|uniref:uracil-DNA glycosylase n=1 Tax=Lacisediminimonas sp. TaxID=3060582 RepID=UPI00271A74DB|nr:uracil-DNA glycosylase [Lacisediminimonas sp.]MDO8299807.1 uracil-DNA glycosylase [Lacisediminimonas sp.]
MIPSQLSPALNRAHPSWRPILEQGLRAIAAADPAYLPALVASDYLPNDNRLFAAFSLPIDAVRTVLVGEGPYPRPESATGVCFMDGAVDALWSDKGLSTRVNRATSLRNFIKMLLVCEGMLSPGECTGEPVAEASRHARSPDSNMIQTLPEMQQSLHGHGFLLLNAALVYRPEVPPIKDARAWRPFLEVVLEALANRTGALPTLVLWGKVAELVAGLDDIGRFPRVVAEHPYNISFIANPAMHAFFRPLHLLRRRAASAPV